MKVTVGGRERIAEVSLSVPEGEDVWIEFKAGDWNVKLNIVFVDVEGESAPEKTRISLEGRGEYGLLTFTNWKNPNPMAFEMPVKLGRAEGRPIVMLANGQTIGKVKTLVLSVFWDETEGRDVQGKVPEMGGGDV